MKKLSISKAVLISVLIFVICGFARIAEYFWIRTDETFLAENFIHKVFGIVVLAVTLLIAKLSWKDIGFTKDKLAKNVFRGLALAASCFFVAYLAEVILLYFMNGNVKLAVYTSGFSLNGEAVKQSGIGFVLLCIVFNIINVWMEEGVFRGLFSRLLSDSMSFGGTAFFSAFLFGIWHWVMPMRDFVEGNSSVGNLLVMGIGYIILSGIMGIKWSMLYKLTGSLWMGLGDHLFNNVVVTNLLHVISNGEADSMQIVRILIGQLISFVLVMVYYRKKATVVKND